MSDVETTTQTEPATHIEAILRILRSGKALAPYVADRIGIKNLSQKIPFVRKEDTDIDIGKYRVRDPDRKLTSAYYIVIPGVNDEELIRTGKAEPPPLYEPEVEQELTEEEEEEEQEEQEEQETLPVAPSAVDTEWSQDETEDEQCISEMRQRAEEAIEKEPDSALVEMMKIHDEVDALADIAEEMETRVRAEQRDVLVDVLVDDMRREIEGLKRHVEELSALAAQPAGRHVEESVRLVDEVAIRLSRDSGVVLEVVDENGERRLYALSRSSGSFWPEGDKTITSSS